MFESLHSLSDSQIIDGTRSTCGREHANMLSGLGFLVETERRKIHLKLGYSSMFKYCTRGLRYSEAEAMLRITAARCVMSFPEIYPLLESREVNLSTVSRASKIINRSNCTAVLNRIRGKSMREVETIAAEYDPAIALPRERVRTIVVRVPVTQAEAIRNSASPAVPEEHLCNSGKISSSVETSTPQNTELQLERRSVITIPADDDFMGMLEQVKMLASHQLRAGMGMQDVLKIAMRYYIKQKDPHARAMRRKATAETKPVQQKTTSSNPRHIPAAVRDEVHVRDQRCTYVGPDGKRCNSPHVLQVDHVKPVARKGAATIDNLRLLCAEHNRLEWRKLTGRPDVLRESFACYAASSRAPA
jgi:5-methylcytosine-specific restriction endonuclease McrA